MLGIPKKDFWLTLVTPLVALDRVYMTALCMLGLLLGGLFYIACFRFGGTLLLQGILIIIPIVIIGMSIVLLEIFAENLMHLDITRFYDLASTWKVLVFCVVCLAGFWGLMRIAGNQMITRYSESGE